ncbi:MAG: glycosyltransferase [Steroidobacteraceae bacterium]
MRFVLFYHSLVSDWNHASAHTLRGIARELLSQGHSVRIFEPADGWSLHNLREQAGDGVIKAFHAIYPALHSDAYHPLRIDFDVALADADVVIAHEWNEPSLLRRLGEHRARTRSYRLLFHDAPHRWFRTVDTPPPLEVRSRVLSHYDGVLASSDGLRRMYDSHGWVEKVWTWRDGVDTRVFRPPNQGECVPSLDLVWIGTWGSAERASELDEFLIEPIRALGLRARFYGARYPQEALNTLRAAGIDYGGWIPDFSIPAALAAGRFTVNVPRRMRADGLPHTPAIRVLEALACGIPVVSAPWDECEQMFTPDVDLLIARDGREMERRMEALHSDPEFARFIGANGYQTIVSRHTCEHRVQELLAICHDLGVGHGRGRDELENTASNLPQLSLMRLGCASQVPAAWS